MLPVGNKIAKKISDKKENVSKLYSILVAIYINIVNLAKMPAIIIFDFE